ncbi:VacJ family lipoprotein [Seohaeicola nanhaiensis]|uniref:VacJ family lipoprotein n=1 Tax=Seohaeicola nanhaiensis TaxID=1387282 RepID=A0ABV9KGC7_9RHOB
MNPKLQPARLAIAAVLLALVSACTTPDRVMRGSGDVFDPYERTNRKIHALNVGLDRVAFRPASKGYVTIVPDPMVESFSNFADNLSMPKNMVNALLQGNPKLFGQALARFLMNTTIGFAGLADPATEFGLPTAQTDFGETLYVWGAQEGAYIELPVLGPSTERDAVGTFVDFFLNPIGYARNQPADNITTYAEIVQRMGDRGKFADTVDSILYESEDSYAQARVIYLQNRRFELVGAGGETYADPYDDAFPDDTYEDPYAE